MIINILQQSTNHKKYLGQHLIVELYDCPADLLSDPVSIEKAMKTAADKMGATTVTSNFHHFSPLGVSGVVIIMESHLTIHTWPEYGYAAVDIFTCGEIDLEIGVTFLQTKLNASKIEQKLIKRGKNVVKS